MTEVWGLLAKSQTDDTTIDEAVDAKIAVHEADPDSHLGESESLQSHKASAIIDHLAGSILADKMTNTDFVIQTSFDSLDGWQKYGSYEATDWPGFSITSQKGTVNYSKVYAQIENRHFGLFSGKEFLWQSVIRFTEYDHHNSVMGPVVLSGYSIDCGFFFLVEEGILKYGYKVDAFEDYFDTEAVMDDDLHTYRISYDTTAEIVYFFYDGVQVGSIDVSGVSMDHDVELSYRIYGETVGEISEMEVINLLYSSEGWRT